MNAGFKRAAILPTGDEVLSGIVQDTDSPMAADVLRGLWPDCQITRETPVSDVQQSIRSRIERAAEENDLVLLIGGSGGGHRFSNTLACDYTHSAMEELLSPCHAVSLYGKNGHLWSRLVCGMLHRTLVLNLPGPFREAQAAMQAFEKIWQQGAPTLEALNRAMALAVQAQYGGSMAGSQ